MGQIFKILVGKAGKEFRACAGRRRNKQDDKDNPADDLRKVQKVSEGRT